MLLLVALGFAGQGALSVSLGNTTDLPGTAQVPTPAPSQHHPLRNEAALKREIREFLGPDIDSYGIMVKRLAVGRGVAINPDQEFYAASLYKLWVRYEESP
ncbi:MAG: hypothetical protein M1358_15600 [Chloroflexi bacterium]|nr:hypothetical protein [Chloroflexota bacterium]